MLNLKVIIEINQLLIMFEIAIPVPNDLKNPIFKTQMVLFLILLIRKLLIGLLNIFQEKLIFI